jgi:hypothetical protein
MKQFLDAIADGTVVVEAKALNEDLRSESMFVGVSALRSLPKERAAAVKASLAQAKILESAETPVGEILAQTGWFIGPDGKWRTEIVDRGNAELKLQPEDLTPGQKYELNDVLKHDELFSMYPSLGEIDVVVDTDMENGNASFDATSWTLTMSPNPSRGSDHLSTVLHEVQHAVQSMEGFAVGGNLQVVNNFSRSNLKKLIASKLVSGEQDVKYLTALKDLLDYGQLQEVADKFDRMLKSQQEVYELSGKLGAAPTDALALQWLQAKQQSDEAVREYNAAHDQAFRDLRLNWATQDRIALDLYKLITGEVEAFDVERRAKMTAEIGRAHV